MNDTAAPLPNMSIMLQNLYTSVLWVDEELTIRWVNLQTEQQFSVSRSRLIDSSIIDILVPVDNDSAKIGTRLSSPSTHSKQQDLQTNLTNQFYNAKTFQQPFIEYSCHIKGAAYPLYVNYSVTPVEHDNATYFLIEIWEKNRQSRIDKEYRLQEQHDVAREMLRSVAHEVKNPLAGIRGAAQLMIKQTQRAQKSKLPSTGDEVTDMDYNMVLVDAKKLTTYADIVISETDRLTTLIGQLLGSNRLPVWESINIHEPLEHVLLLTQSQLPKVKIERDYDLSIPELTADKNQLIQVFLNLVNNACDAMLEQDLSLREADYQHILRISTRIKHQYTIGAVHHRQVLKICIHDTGAGINPEIIERIFFPLVTGRANGTGLGLALVQEMIHRHQGSIEVSSEVGNTAFCIFLPFEQKNDD